MSERGKVNERFGIHAGLAMPDSGARERGTLIVARWDEDASSWTSRKMGGEKAGHPGFIQPNDNHFHRYKVDPYSVTESTESNLITQAGWGRILTLAIAGGGQGWDATHTRIGVGTATAAATTGDTDIAGTTSAGRWWQLVTGAGATGTGTGTARLTFVATVGTGSANFAWAEWGIDQGTASGSGTVTAPLLNRAVSPQGQKASGQTWTATSLLDWT